MVSESNDRDAARRVAEEVFREKVGLLIRAVALAFSAMFGLLLTASSFNLAVYFTIPGVLLGAAIVFLSARGVVRTLSKL